MKRVVVAIDGPAGAGKSTVARMVAEKLGARFLDTGAMYRAVTWAVIDAGIDLDAAKLDSDAITEIALAAKIELNEDGTTRVNSQDVTAAIRQKTVSSKVSVVAANPDVRSFLVAEQRRWVANHQGSSVVLEGRDIATVVLPDADVKIFLTAAPEERANRRLAESPESDHSQILSEIIRRDKLDTEREHDPLTQHDEAHLVDTTNLTIEEVVAKIAGLAKAA